jgi:hypothetical protein
MTSSTPLPSPTDDLLIHDDRWGLTLRVVASHHFGKAVQLRELLLYLAKRAIACPNEDVSEQEIGCRVLGRRPDYDPQADNIVRVQIRRLRQKLDEYFLADGQHELMVISIPKGSHVLRFEPRIDSSRVEQPPVSPPSFGKFWFKVLIPLVLVAVIAFFLGRFSGPGKSTASKNNSVLTANPLWTRLFLKDQRTSIVIADSSLVIVQNVLQKSIKLNEYIDHSYRDLIGIVPNPQVRDALQMISLRQYTSLADATLSGELSSIGTRMDSSVAVRFARHLNIRDFHSGNFVLIGSSHGVPWVELFEPNLNFQFERIGTGQRFGFRNKKPLDGEMAIYESTQPSRAPQQSFATISMVPNLGNNGTVLMLTGITMEATEAAGEFAISDEFPRVLGNVFGLSSGEKLPYFQILLKAASVAGAPHKVAVVAWRKLPI